MLRTPAHLAAAALTLALACTDRPLDGESETAAFTGTTSDPTRGPTTTATSGTTTTTTGPTTITTTGPSTVTATSSTTGPATVTATVTTATSQPGFCGDGVCDPGFGEDGCSCPADCYGCALPPSVLYGCPEAWHGGSKVWAQESGFGPFDGATAYFAWAGFGYAESSELRLLIFDAAVDHETAKTSPWSNEPYALRLYAPWNYDAWLSSGELSGYFQRQWELIDTTVAVTITDRVGNWEFMDPNDPPRLLGWVSPIDDFDPNGPNGPFDAVFCDAFVEQIIPE